MVGERERLERKRGGTREGLEMEGGEGAKRESDIYIYIYI